MLVYEAFNDACFMKHSVVNIS